MFPLSGEFRWNRWRNTPYCTETPVTQSWTSWPRRRRQ